MNYVIFVGDSLAGDLVLLRYGSRFELLVWLHNLSIHMQYILSRYIEI